MSVRPLSPALAEKARLELNEDPKRLKEDLQAIKDWIAKQPHLRARTDDQWLLAFLRGCKFSLERTKEKLDNYYTLRSTVPEFEKIKYNDPLFEEILNLGVFVLLPNTHGPDGRRVNLMRWGKYDPAKYSLFDLMSVNNTLMKVMLMEDDHCIVAGAEGILDLEGVTMAHFLQMTPVSMKKMVAFGQGSYDSMIRVFPGIRQLAKICMCIINLGVLYLNTPTGFETVFNAIKGLLNEKNRSRLYVHNKNYEALYEHIPQELLPNEYGGKAGTIEEINDYWKKKVKEYSSFLEEDLKYGTDESKRPGKPKTAEDMFGVEGSFRQLDFD